MPYFPKAEYIVELFVQAEAISCPSLLSSVFFSAKRLLIALMQDIRFIRYIDFEILRTKEGLLVEGERGRWGRVLGRESPSEQVWTGPVLSHGVPPWTDRQTQLKTLPSRIRSLREVKTVKFNGICVMYGNALVEVASQIILSSNFSTQTVLFSCHNF